MPLGAILAIGDQWNDIEMLAEVGHGAAMPTAPAEVKAVARYIAPPLAEEGVARMIEALVLASPRRPAAASERLAVRRRRRARRSGRRRGRPEAVVRRDRPHRAPTMRRSGGGDRGPAVGGGIVALPTDTVYGIAVALETPGGIERLFQVKQRPPDKGIVLLLDRRGAGGDDRDRDPGAATALADACWPGGLTLVVPRRARRRAARRR